MALREQSKTFKFTGGVETKMDSKAVPLVRLLELENGVFTKASSIKKRNGYVARSLEIDGSTDLVEGARRNAVRGDEYLLFTNDRCYSKISGSDKWSDAGAVMCPLGRTRPAVHTGSAQTMPDHATNEGVTVCAWEDSRGGVWWTAVDATSGRVYRTPTQAHANGERPRCVAVGNVLHVYYAVPTLRAIYVVVVNPSAPSAAVAPYLLVEDLDSTNPVYDACPTMRTGTPAAIAWHEYATTNVRVGYVLPGGTLGSPAGGTAPVATVAAALTASSPLAVAFDYIDGTAISDSFVLAYVSGTDGVVQGLAAGDTAVPIGAGIALPIYTATSVQRIALATAGRTIYVAFEEAAAEASERYVVVNSLSTVEGLGTEHTLRSVGLASRAFTIGDSVFAVFVHDTTYFNTYLTYRLSDFLQVGRHMCAEASGAPTRTHLPSAHVIGDVVKVVLPGKTRLKSEANDKFTESALYTITLDFDSDDSHQTAQLGAGLYMAGAVAQHYDGRVWTEQGFNVGPERITHTTGSGGSLTTGAVPYAYKVWYESTDAQGEIHRGPESVEHSVTMNADTKVTLTLPTLRVTAKSNVRICVARCLQGDTSRFWRVSSLDPTVTGNNGFIANDTTVDSVVFVDTMSDTDLRLQEEMYTTGGILSNDPSNLGNVLAVGKNRIFFTDAADPNIIRFSQERATGFGLEVAPELQLDVDPAGGAITGLIEADGVVHVLKDSAVFLFNGDGPFATGTTSTGTIISGFSKPQKCKGNIGCTDPSSIIASPVGVMFSGDQGIWRVSLDGTLQYVGAPVEAYNSQSVRRATLLPKRTAIIFLTDEGKSLYYDYLFDQWSTFTNHEGYDAAVIDGVYHYLRKDSRVFVETLDQHTDAGARIKLLLTTAHIHMLDHLQGFQRFWEAWLLGTWVSPHQLGVSWSLDYREEWNDASWLDATGDTDSTGWLTGEGCATIGEDPITGTTYGEGAYGDGPYGGEANDEYQWKFGIFDGGEAIQFRFEDFEKAGLAGASFELTELTIVGGVKGNTYRPMPGARST